MKVFDRKINESCGKFNGITTFEVHGNTARGYYAYYRSMVFLFTHFFYFLNDFNPILHCFIHYFVRCIYYNLGGILRRALFEQIEDFFLNLFLLRFNINSQRITCVL